MKKYIYCIILNCVTTLIVIAGGVEMVQYELKRYQELSELKPEFSEVVDLLLNVENEPLANTYPHWIEPYRASLAYFATGNVDLLNQQTIELPFSHMWLYPYVETDDTVNRQSVIATFDYARKVNLYRETVPDMDRNLILGALHELGNLMRYQHGRICEISSSEFILIYMTQIYFENLLSEVHDLSGYEALVSGWSASSQDIMILTQDSCPELIEEVIQYLEKIGSKAEEIGLSEAELKRVLKRLLPDDNI